MTIINCPCTDHSDLTTTERQLLSDFGIEGWSMIAASRAQDAQIEADAYWDRIKALSDRPDEEDTDCDFGPLEEDWYGAEDVENVQIYSNSVHVLTQDTHSW